ncbi:membrane protein, putative [Roseobacter denitrificans OCh 114]|uniref:Membrane protein, putative n=1 Tax=Roseobacter denitrificans (strain ATCC 33942 / OCh 114) TaxID=375451 RepID=Q16CM2_ROSDO|nr:membrane protein, putative [Roseobacter denitrificans OCh 114]
MLVANTILGTAFPIQLILGGLAGLVLAPSPTLATLPASIQTLAGMVAAAPISLLMGRMGRRAGFALGGLMTLMGATTATQALYADNFVLLCVAHFLMGAGWASFQYFRFAAGEVVEKKWRPVAISLMLSSLLIAAIGGPQLFIAAKDILAPVPFAGAYVATGLIAVLGLVPLLAVQMPQPKGSSQDTPARKFAPRAALRRPAIMHAVGIAAVSQGVMVFLMIPTPIAMVGCGFSEDTAGDVVRWHIVAMFAPSFFTGFLIKRFGASTVAITGLIIIVAAAVAATLGLSAMHFYGALIVLGVGWNFGFIGATAMLDAAVSENKKATVQGANDTIIALVSTICAFAAGFVVSSLGWVFLAMISGGVVVLALGVLFADRARVSHT